MPLSLNNNRGSVYSGRMKIEVSDSVLLPWHGVAGMTARMDATSNNSGVS